MYIDDTISTVKSLVGFTDVTDIGRPVMYTEFNTLIVEIKNLSMEVNFMDSSDGLGRSKNNIGADIQVSIVSVSYTHLDVYKRQIWGSLLIISFGYLIFCVHKSQCNCEINWEVKSSGTAI